MASTRHNHKSIPAELGPRSRWQARANRRIEYNPGPLGGHAAVVRRNEFVTAAYAEMYLRNPAIYKWAGMAALTSAAVGRGMYMTHYLHQSHLATLVNLFGREVAAVSATLGVGNLAVFNDIYWQHMAYENGGLAEIRRAYRAGQLPHTVYRAWQLIDEGRATGAAALVWAGNRDLLYYEQRVILQPAVYDGNERLWRLMSGWVLSPIPGHLETIEDFEPGANMAVFGDRWRWIEGRMLPRWKALDAEQPERVAGQLQGWLIGGPPFPLPLSLKRRALGRRLAMV